MCARVVSSFGSKHNSKLNNFCTVSGLVNNYTHSSAVVCCAFIPGSGFREYQKFNTRENVSPWFYLI